jgi:hypothetical protein
MRKLLCLCALVALTTTACRTNPDGSRKPAIGADCNYNLAMRMDRSDWMVNEATNVSRVMSARQPNRPPEHIGYLVEKRYRQMRGGPQFTMYSVTTLDRDEQIGHIDQLGRAVRYEPRRNGTFESVPAGSNTLERNVQSIFDTKHRITFRPTNERRIAFDSLDVNGDGLLQLTETASFGDRITGADRNGDGVVDFAEFDAIDVL